MDFKKWWPSLVAGAVALWGVFGTQIQAVVMAHPTLVAVLGPVIAILMHLLPSPVAKSSGLAPIKK
jgi:hypothetical protein